MRVSTHLWIWLKAAFLWRPRTMLGRAFRLLQPTQTTDSIYHLIIPIHFTDFRRRRDCSVRYFTERDVDGPTKLNAVDEWYVTAVDSVGLDNGKPDNRTGHDTAAPWKRWIKRHSTSHCSTCQWRTSPELASIYLARRKNTGPHELVSVLMLNVMSHFITQSTGHGLTIR